MHHEICDVSGNAILGLFGAEQVITYSVGEFGGDWENLKVLVENWWTAYKLWEKCDTLADAFAEQRLTVKGTSLMERGISAHTVPKKTEDRFAAKWDKPTTFTQQIKKTNASILARLDPAVFVPAVGEPSLKTEKGFHDLSGLLLNPNADISSQQYKGNDGKIDFDQVYVFMPLSYALDQAVFQNINTLAKANRKAQKDFYDKVRDIRSKMTRIKLAAEHDMAVAFINVAEPGALGGPKFQYTLLSTTDVSRRDEASGAIPGGTLKSKLTKPRIEDGLKKADPPLAIGEGDRVRLAAKLVTELNALLDTEFDPPDLPPKVAAIFNDRKVLDRLATLKPAPTPQLLERCKEAILAYAGGKTQTGYRTTVGILEARQRAAINYQQLILGQMMRYAEVTIAYRQHAGIGANSFPKFAKFDIGRKLWIVGTINAENVWTANNPEETFTDRAA